MLVLEHYLIDNEQPQLQQLGTFQVITNGSTAQELEEELKQLGVVFQEYIHTYSAWKWVKNYCKSKPIGCIDFARSNLEVKYSGKQFWVSSFDGAKLDCMILPGSGTAEIATHRMLECADARAGNLYRSNSPGQGVFPNQNLELNPCLPTVLFCNPNGALYELLNVQGEWLEYYINLGVNLVIWNYRGYGRSKQRCKMLRPSYMQRDGEYVMQYVQSNLVRGKVGIHGESMGGSIASHIATKSTLSYACINRTFSSLHQVAYWSVAGKVASAMLSLFTFGWGDHGLENFQRI